MENYQVEVKRKPGRPRTRPLHKQLSEEEYARRNEAEKKRQAKNISDAIEMLGGECAVTGLKQNLEFHHLEPSKLGFRLQGGTNRPTSRKAVLAEAKKCILLHAEVHRQIHREIDAELAEIEKTTDLTEGGRKGLIDYLTRTITNRRIRVAAIQRELRDV